MSLDSAATSSKMDSDTKPITVETIKPKHPYKVVSSHFDIILQHACTPTLDILNVEGILCFCKTSSGVYFFQWKAFEDVYKETVLAKPSGSKKQPFVKSTLETCLADLSGIAFGEDNTLHFFKEPRWAIHSRYLFAKGSSRSFVETLERMGLVRRSASKQHLFYALRVVDHDAPDLYYYEPSWGRLTWVKGQVSDGSTTAISDAESQIIQARREVHRKQPVDDAFWRRFALDNGKTYYFPELQETIFKGGIAVESRPIVWKYLLGLHKWESTAQENETRVSQKRNTYRKLKEQWQSLKPSDELKYHVFRARRNEIERDVEQVRRSNEFFTGDNNPNLTKVQHILISYAMHNYDLGYVPGMVDMLLPILSVVQDEEDSFWCFVGFMEKVSCNFDIHMTTMRKQREQLRMLLSVVNKKLYQYLESRSSNMLFCYRWLQFCFSRDFALQDVVCIWEVLWSDLPCQNYHLFVCAAILEQLTDEFVEGQLKDPMMVDHAMHLSGKMNVKAILEQAEGIYLRMKKLLEVCTGKYASMRKIIGVK